MTLIKAIPLSASAFEPFGSVIEAVGTTQPINGGTTNKFSDLAQIQLDAGATATLHIYRPDTIALPHPLTFIERHPLASQAFIPLGHATFVVVVAATKSRPTASDITAFVTNGTQGIQFDAGIWHHSFLALDAADFLIVDRYCRDQAEAESNLEAFEIDDWNLVLA